MAQILTHQKNLTLSYKKKERSRFAFTLLGVLILFLAFLVGSVEFAIGIVLGIVGVVFLSVADTRAKERDIYGAGIEGEKQVTALLSSLPGDWYILNDLKIGRLQIDHVVVCPKGVYTVETKNYKGTIYADAEKKEWVQINSYGRKKTFYNPVRQATSHSSALGAYLRRSGFEKIWVNPVVVFCEPNGKDNVEDRDGVALQIKFTPPLPKVPVLRSSDLSGFFSSRMNTISFERCEQIAKLLINDNCKVSN